MEKFNVRAKTTLNKLEDLAGALQQREILLTKNLTAADKNVKQWNTLQDTSSSYKKESDGYHDELKTSLQTVETITQELIQLQQEIGEMESWKEEALTITNGLQSNYERILSTVNQATKEFYELEDATLTSIHSEQEHQTDKHTLAPKPTIQEIQEFIEAETNETRIASAASMPFYKRIVIPNELLQQKEEDNLEEESPSTKSKENQEDRSGKKTTNKTAQ